MSSNPTNGPSDGRNKEADYLLYEHPLNEHIRTHLRLESLFQAQLSLRATDSASSHVAALHNILEILDCLDRGDIKGELIKELELQKSHFTQLQKNPYIDELKLRKFLQQLDQLFSWVTQYPGKFGSLLRTDRFIELINNRMRIPGGSCSFDLPELHFFLNQNYEQRMQQFLDWYSHLKGLHQCISILLRLYRENGVFESCEANKGAFQYHFTKQKNPQLLRIKLASDSLVFPEISGSKHLCNIRFLESSKNDIVASQKNHNFQLAVC